MELKVRKMTWADLDRACEVETASIKGVKYLRDVADEFINDTIGELGVVEIDGKVVGVGKYTILYDGGAWLETLRVDPEYQGRGVGKAFYNRFFELANQQGVNRMGMYTGFTNVVSKGLALRYGFQVTGRYSGANLAITGQEEISEEIANDFRLLSEEEAAEKMAVMAEPWEGHMIMNRTFYPMNNDLYRGLARDQKVYYDLKGDNLVVLGARFMPQTALHIGLYRGDAKKILAFAKYMAVKRNVPKITIMFPPALTKIKEELLSEGFISEAGDCIVCEWHRS